MEFMIPLNSAATRSLLVEQEHTAKMLGSGNVEVLATPMLIALMENAALEAVQKYLNSEWTTVGTRVDIDHLRATPLGGVVTAEAVLVTRKGRILTFHVEARDNRGLVGQGTHQRAVINLEKFMNKLK